jgi:hypothetical protein
MIWNFYSKVASIILANLLQWNSRTFLASRTEPNRTELNMASRDPNFFNISMFFRVRFDRTKLCFIAFEWFYMMYLMHLNDFYEFDSIKPNSKKHRNIKKIRFGSIELIRFGSIFQESFRVSLYIYIYMNYMYV